MGCHDEGVSSESFWIRKRERPLRSNGRSTVNGKTAAELIEEHAEAIRNMTPEELEALADEMVAQARASRAECEEAAAWRRAQRYRMN